MSPADVRALGRVRRDHAYTRAGAARVATGSPSALAQPQDQLDALVAPIALYPDQLLTQVLIASTYSLEVVEAARFVQQNPNLKGDALESKTWDPSV